LSVNAGNYILLFFESDKSFEMFGDINGAAANESTPFSPRSPYAVAKATAFWEVANYREAYGLFASPVDLI
jgi:GDPmannose 4,6-dehydratase